MINPLYRLNQDENGATLVEYGFIILLVVLVTVATLKTLGPEVANLFGSVAPKI